MTHVIQSVLTTLCAAEWVSVTAARVLIGTFCRYADPSVAARVLFYTAVRRSTAFSKNEAFGGS
jgi:hypothetical protein